MSADIRSFMQTIAREQSWNEFLCSNKLAYESNPEFLYYVIVLVYSLIVLIPYREATTLLRLEKYPYETQL